MKPPRGARRFEHDSLPRRAALLAAAALATAGCEATLPPLYLDSVTPPVGSQGLPTRLLLVGSFYSPVATDLASGEQRVREDFLGWVCDVPLARLSLISDEEISAEAPPGREPGLYGVTIGDPLGRRATLDVAFTIVPPDDAGPRVEILQPDNGEHVRAGSSFLVRFRATERQPGRVTRVDWSVSGARTNVDGREYEPSAVIEDFFVVEVSLVSEVRLIAVDVLASDDAPDPNSGGDTVEVVIDNCEHERDCDDDRFCNGREICVSGWCGAGDPILCIDPFECTLDACDEALGQCLHEPRGELCDDGLACTGEEVCTVEAGCVAGAPLCDDGLDCTADYCDEGTLHCWSEAEDERCSDGVFCNGDEVCDEELGCVSGPPPCSDGLECTVDQCNEGSQSCGHLPDHGVCNDGDPCVAGRCDLWEGCVVTHGTEGPIGTPSCDDGGDSDCDGLVDEDDPDCDPVRCSDLTAAPVREGLASLEVDLCADGLDPALIHCESDRNELVLAGSDFEAGVGEVDTEGAVVVVADAQDPGRPGSWGLMLCGDGAVAELSVDTRTRRGIGLRLSLANVTLGSGEYVEVLVAPDGTSPWEAVLIAGDGVFRPRRRQTILLPPEAEELHDLRVRVEVSGLSGCAAVDDLEVVDLPPLATWSDVVLEDFEVDFGAFLVFDPTGGDIFRAPSPTGMAAQISGGGGAWIGAFLRAPLAAATEWLTVEVTMEGVALGPDAYGLVQYSVDRGTTWVDLLGTGLDRPSSSLRLGGVVPEADHWAEEVQVRVISPATSVAVGGDGLRVDDVAIRVVEPVLIDTISAFTDEGGGLYSATLLTATSGTATVRCAYSTGAAYAVWTEAVSLEL